LDAPERVETFEYQPARVAQKFVKTHEAKHDHRIVIVALNAFTLAAWAPHVYKIPEKRNRQRKSLITEPWSC
jgi:hypothetical protein